MGRDASGAAPPRDVPRPSQFQRRALATELDASAFAELPRVRALAMQVLQPVGEEAREARVTEAVVTATLGTILWSGVTKRDLWTGLGSLRRNELDLEAGVLVLRLNETPGTGEQNGGHRERFPLHPLSRLLWGRLLLVCQAGAGGQSEGWLLPSVWRDPARLRLASGDRLRRAGFPRWSTFLAAVRLMHLLGALTPVAIGRRAGRVIGVPVPAPHWCRLGWRVGDDIDAEDRAERSRPSHGPIRLVSKVPSWRRAMQEALGGLGGETTGEVRDQMARSVERLRDDPAWLTQAGTIGRLVGEWAIHLLRHCRQYRPNTARTWLARLGRAVDAGRLTEGLLDPAPQTYVVATVRGILAVYTRGESQRVMRTALRLFLRFAASRGASVPRIPWSRPELAVHADARAMPLVTPGDIRAVADALRDTGPEGLALAVATVLGGFAGLRRLEICWLAADDVPGDCRWTLRVSRSKTPTGRRFVPLGLLAPRWAVELLDEYRESRSKCRPGNGPWLLTAGGSRWHPDALGERVSRELRKLAGGCLTFHSLRRSCATWWLIRWVVDQDDIPAPAALVDGPPAAGVRAVLGEDPAHVLWALARLLGHASPSVTVSRYVLGLDWLEAQALAGTGEMALPWSVISGLLLVTPRRARQLVPVIGTDAQAGAVVTAQLRRLAREPRGIGIIGRPHSWTPSDRRNPTPSGRGARTAKTVSLPGLDMVDGGAMGCGEIPER